ncbi:MAG: Zn-ribbon domain-containing OB-fold protein [Anaerolineae bacterium]|nr:Zn-ribbon domain-containing OB-fold protein [Anaerolineae bacterium]MDQ7035946.1 Zn-ribbon domain-containing OB-fold protein [Anaerolineae bacterium]
MAQVRTNHISESYEFAGTGEVYSYTVVQDPPLGYEDNAPYILALVKLDEGAIITAQLTDVDDNITIGDRVEMVTRKLTSEGQQGMIIYGYKFRPMLLS